MCTFRRGTIRDKDGNVVATVHQKINDCGKKTCVASMAYEEPKKK